jgi:hypothetical protein
MGVEQIIATRPSGSSPLAAYPVCPACGYAEAVTEPISAWQPKPNPWWPWILVAVGLGVLGYFGSALWGLNLTDILAPLSAPEARLKPEGLRDPFFWELRHWVTHKLEGLTVGAVAVVVGITAVARRKLDPVVAPSVPLIRTLFALWVLSETVLLSVFRLMLVIFCIVVAVSAVRGEPPSWDVVAHAVDRTLDAALALVDLTTGLLRLPA